MNVGLAHHCGDSRAHPGCCHTVAQTIKNWEFWMKTILNSALCAVMIVVLAACGGQTSVDEELLPTRVATLSAGDFAVTLPAATPVPATPVPAAPTATP